MTAEEGVETTPFYESLIMTSLKDLAYCYPAYSFVCLLSLEHFSFDIFLVGVSRVSSSYCQIPKDNNSFL
jgi:hypothetical protein